MIIKSHHPSSAISAMTALCIYPILICIYLACYYSVQTLQNRAILKFFPNITVDHSEPITYIVVSGVVIGGLLGYAQWYILRHASAISKRSVWINILLWLLSIGLAWIFFDWLSHLPRFDRSGTILLGMSRTLGDIFWPTPSATLIFSLVLLYIIFSMVVFSRKLLRKKGDTTLYKFLNRIWWFSAQLVVLAISVITIAFFIGRVLPAIHTTQILLHNETSEQIAIQHFAEKHEIQTENIHVGQPALIRHRETKRFLWQAKLFEYRSDGPKNPEAITVDRRNGKVVDGTEVRQTEKDVYLAKYGKLEPELYEFLQRVDENELLPISIWLNVDIDSVREEIVSRYPEANLEGFLPGKETDLELYEQIRAEMTEADTEAYQQAAEPIVARLAEQGIQISYADKYAPMLFVKLPKSLILELEEYEVVNTLYLSR